MMCDDWCGLCYTNKKGRTNAKGHVGYRAPAKVLPLGSFTMKEGTYGHKPKEEGEARPAPSKEFSDLPLLWEFLVHRAFESGKPRARGSLTLFFQDGHWKACISDKHSDSIAFVTDDSLLGLAYAIERGMHAYSLDWRPGSPVPKKR